MDMNIRYFIYNSGGPYKIQNPLHQVQCDGFATNACRTGRLIFQHVKPKMLPVSFNWQPFTHECSDVCAAESTNGAAQVHVAGQT